MQNDGILGYATNATEEYNKAVSNEQGMLQEYLNYLNNNMNSEEKEDSDAGTEIETVTITLKTTGGEKIITTLTEMDGMIYEDSGVSVYDIKVEKGKRINLPFKLGGYFNESSWPLSSNEINDYTSINTMLEETGNALIFHSSDPIEAIVENGDSLGEIQSFEEPITFLAQQNTTILIYVDP